MIKLWIDNMRPAPEGYRWCKSIDDAITEIIYDELNIEYEGEIYLISLDYNANDYIRLLDWLEETGRNYPIRIHSQNPVGVANMRRIIQRNNWKEVF